MRATAESFVLAEKGKPLLYPVKQIGSRAKALFAQPGFSGKVLAVLSKSVYLLGEDGEILWLSREGLVMHRRSVLLSPWPAAICVGQDFFARSSFLQIPEAATLDLDSATEWRPSAVGPGCAKPLHFLHARIRRLFVAAIMLGNARGLGRMTPLISSLVDGNKETIATTDPLLAKARDSILDLATACLEFDIPEVTRKGRELVGLGPGLTPSGDDFLGGVLFAAHSLKMAYPQDFIWEEGLVTELIHWASTQTHPISHAILRDHALGHGPAPLHDVVASLLSGQDLSDTMEGVERLLRMGETSGWDILTGMLTGMLLVVGKLKNTNGGKH
jgi:hypothetical protein